MFNVYQSLWRCIFAETCRYVAQCSQHIYMLSRDGCLRSLAIDRNITEGPYVQGHMGHVQAIKSPESEQCFYCVLKCNASLWDISKSISSLVGGCQKETWLGTVLGTDGGERWGTNSWGLNIYLGLIYFAARMINEPWLIMRNASLITCMDKKLFFDV